MDHALLISSQQMAGQPSSFAISWRLVRSKVGTGGSTDAGLRAGRRGDRRFHRNPAGGSGRADRRPGARGHARGAACPRVAGGVRRPPGHRPGPGRVRPGRARGTGSGDPGRQGAIRPVRGRGHPASAGPADDGADGDERRPVVVLRRFRRPVPGTSPRQRGPGRANRGRDPGPPRHRRSRPHELQRCRAGRDPAPPRGRAHHRRAGPHRIAAHPRPWPASWNPAGSRSPCRPAFTRTSGTSSGAT